MFSHSDVVDVVLKTIDLDKTRESHTVESLISVLTLMGIVTPFTAQPTWTPLHIRLMVARLLEHGQLDMRPDGTLILPDESTDPAGECFLGSWYVTTTTGLVKGPYKSALEAQNEYASLCFKGLQAVGG